MAVFSLPQYKTVTTPCIEYVHPWNDSCVNATYGLLIHAFSYSLRTYTTVYLFTLIMRRKKLTKKVIKQTILGILQSTIFLTTHSYGFSSTLCALRHLTGRFDKYSVAFTPAFLSSLVAIQLERPSRRPILCLYVTNVATETLFRMAVWRGWVKPVKYGEIIIFTLSTTALLYLFRSDPSANDSMFSVLRYVVGRHEEVKSSERPLELDSPTPSRSSQSYSSDNYSMYVIIANICRTYGRIINYIKTARRAPTCPHPHSCVSYSVQGLVKMLAVGYSVQVVLRFVLSAKRLLRKPSLMSKIFFADKVLNLGAFLGLFSFLFRGSSCALRWLRGCDSEFHAIPAGLLAGLAFWFYPDNTAALYVMWKALQILYTKMIEAGYLPEIPCGTVLLYSFSTAVLFHASLLEPHNLRPSYYRFLHGLSGGRISVMKRECLDPFGLATSQYHKEGNPLKERWISLSFFFDPTFTIPYYFNITFQIIKAHVKYKNEITHGL